MKDLRMDSVYFALDTRLDSSHIERLYYVLRITDTLLG